MKKLEETQIQELIEKAISMMDHSYSPYSHFHVGAAPVSYTHLDVYKRQVPDYAGNNQRQLISEDTERFL